MQRLGVNAFTRKAANMVKPRCIITARGDGYRMESVSEFKTTGFDFRLDEPFMEKTPDGRRVKSTITLAGDVLNQVQAGEKTTHIDRIINGDALETVSILLLLADDRSLTSNETHLSYRRGLSRLNPSNCDLQTMVT
ncbi:unnamed protein product [Dibothriocephalus latus]|uniref:Uncharacterized protein n=1 Tax=Dibothriocephalus latus TaxID=60516 RepID=A0A3P7REU8_DIBLA|nr:unnamed protein product [Dibothriocephalus latus]